MTFTNEQNPGDGQPQPTDQPDFERHEPTAPTGADDLSGLDQGVLAESAAESEVISPLADTTTNGRSKKTKVIAAGGVVALIAAGGAFFANRGPSHEEVRSARSHVGFNTGPDATPSTTELSFDPSRDIVAMRFVGEELNVKPIQDPADPEAAAKSVLDLMGCYLGTLDENCLNALNPNGGMAGLADMGKRINVFDENGQHYRPDQQFIFFPDPTDPPVFEVTGKTATETTISLTSGRELFSNVLSDGYPWGDELLIKKCPAEGLLSKFTVTLEETSPGQWAVSHSDYYFGNNLHGNPYAKN